MAKLHWVELQIGFYGCVHIVKCKICMEVEYKTNYWHLNGIHFISMQVVEKLKEF
jgi:hypothetical protein